MISNLNGSVRVLRKKRFLPVRGSGSGSVRLPGINAQLNTGSLLKNAKINFRPRPTGA